MCICEEAGDKGLQKVYSGTSLIRTPEMRTPRFNGHFAQVRNHSHSLLYIFTSEMRTPRYSV